MNGDPIKQALRDFVATSNSGKYKSEDELFSKFPEFEGYDRQVLRDFVATSNSGKYKTEDELFSKFPEFSTSPVKKKEPSDSKLVGSPIGSAVGEAAKMAARQQEPPVVSPKLGSIVQKAQGSLPQSAGSAVSGLEKGSPSMLKSTSVSEGEAPKTEDLATSPEKTDYDLLASRIKLSLTPGGNIPQEGQKSVREIQDEGKAIRLEGDKTLKEKALQPTWQGTEGKKAILKERYQDFIKSLEPEMEQMAKIDNLQREIDLLNNQAKSLGVEGAFLSPENAQKMADIDERKSMLEETLKFEKLSWEDKIKTLSSSYGLSLLQAGGNRLLEGISKMPKGTAVMMSSDNDLLEGLSWFLMPGAKLAWELSADENAKPKDNPLYQLGEVIDNYRKDANHISPLVEEYFSYKMMTALTGDLPLYGTAGALGGPAAVSVLGAFDNGISEYEDAKKKTFDANSMTMDEFINAYSNEDKSNMASVINTYSKLKGKDPEEVASQMFLFAGGVGTLEGLPFVNWVQKFDKATGGGVTGYFKKKGISAFLESMQKGVANPFLQGGEEMIQEVTSEFLTNVSANKVYDETRELTSGLMDAGEVGFGMGFVLGALKVGVGSLQERRQVANSQKERDEIDRSIALLNQYQEMISGGKSLTGEKATSAKNKLEQIENKIAQGGLSENEVSALADAKVVAEKEYNEAIKSEMDRISAEGRVIQLEEKAAAVSDVAPEQAADFLAEAERLRKDIMESAPEKAASPEVVPPVVEQTTADVGGEISPDVSLTETTEALVASPENVALKDVESTTKALEELSKKKKTAATETGTKIVGDEIVEETDVNSETLGISQKISEGFTKAGEQSKINKSPKALGEWLINNAQTGDRIIVDEDTYWVVERKTDKKGNTEIELQQYFRNENDVFENNPSAVKLFNSKHIGTETAKLATRDASDLFENSYRNSNGDVVIQQSKYIPASKDNKSISEAYHKAKADGSNPELVKAVEELLVGKKAASPETEQIQTQDDSTDITGVSGEVQGEELVEVGEAPKKATSPTTEAAQSVVSPESVSVEESVKNKTLDELLSKDGKIKGDGGKELNVKNVVEGQTKKILITDNEGSVVYVIPLKSDGTMFDSVRDSLSFLEETNKQSLQETPQTPQPRVASPEISTPVQEVISPPITESAPEKATSPKEIKAELDKRNTGDVFVPVEEGGILGSQNFKKKAQQMFMAFKKVTWDDVYSKRNRKPEYATKQGQRKFEKEFEKWAKENKNQIIAESYVESKANGTNKEFVEAVDNLLASPKETKRTKEIRERRQKAQAIIEKRKLQEEKESQKEAGEFRKTVIAESRKAQPTAYRAVLQYFMQGGKVPVVIFEREVSKQKSEIDRRAGINGILERVDVSETDLKRKGLDAIAERIVGDMGVTGDKFSDMQYEVVGELKEVMRLIETDTDARALLYEEIEGALSEEEKRAKEGEEEKIYREKKAKEKEGRVEIDEEFTGAELKEMADEQAELDRVKALENELEERKKKIKELWEKGKSALEKGGITGNSWKELGESNADLLKEVSAYVYAYAKLTGAKLKQAIKNVNDELFGGAFDIDEMAASPELIKAHEKGLADKGKTEVEEILEEETTTGEKRKKSTEQRVLEGGKAEPEVILGLIEQGVDYMEQSQDLSRKVADKVVAAYKRKFGDNWKVELESDLDAGVFSESRLGAIPAYLYDLLINSSEGLVKARLINKLSTVLRGFGQFISAMNDIQLRNPDALYAVTIERQRRMFEQILGGGVKGKAVNPRSKLGKIKDAQERLRRAKKESISEAAEKVTSKGQAKKGALSPEKRKERGKKKVDEALEGLKQWLTNPKMSAKMDLNDLYENQKEFNGLIFKLADGFFDQGVANAAQLITKMKEALANLGIDEDSFDSIKDRFLSDFDLENKLMDQRREEGAEKLAKKIVNLVKQPKKKEFDPVKQMVETLFGKVKETVTVPAKPKATAEEKIQEALTNFYEYESVFYKSRLEVIDMIDALDISDAEKRAMKDKLEKYMTEELNVPFGEKLSSEYVKQKMKEKAVDIKKVLLTANEIQAATREQFVSELVDKLRLDANLTASEAKKIADEFYKEYDKLIEAKKGQILKQTIGADVKAKFARKPEHQRIMEAIKHGALDGKMIKVKNEKGETGEYDSTYLFAEKYGIPDIYNPEIQETLKAFTESIAKLPPNSVQRKIVEREFNTYLDYLKGESKNRWQTILGMQYANILFDYGTHATIIASNIPMTMFNAALKIGRKLVFEQSRIKELGTLGHMMLKGFAKSSLSAKGILLYDTMREGSQVGRKDILRIKSKYANNKFLRGYFKFLSFSGRVLDALDAFVTVSMTDVEYTDFILDRLNAENKKLPKSERLTNKEIREYAYEIMGQTAPIVEQAENQATEEFKEQYGDDFEMTGKTAVLWKQRVEEIKRELGMERIKGPKIPDWVSFTSQDMQRLFEQGTERAGKIGLVGKPAGSIGIVSALLEKMFQNILGGELLVKFLNAGMNSAAFVLKATPVSIVPVVKYYWTGKRGVGTSSSSDKIYEDLGVRREMYGYGGRIEKREELLTWLGFQAMTAIFMGSMFGEQAMTIFKSMFGGDDDDPEKTKNLGVEGRELYFGKKMDGKSGKWKEGLFVTGRMFGDSGNNWRKTQAFTQATGIEPMTVYYKGKKMFTYRNNPVYTAMFGTTGVASDLLLFNDKMDEITQGFMFKVAVSQSLMTLESSPMKGVSEIFALSAMRGDMVNMSDETFQRTLDGAIKTMALQTRNAFIPRFLMTMEQDVEGAMSQEDRIDLSWYELATRDWPIVNNLFDREIKYDHFGRPLLRKTKAKSFLLGVPAVDVADGTVYSPVLFDVSNEGEVSSPFANSVRGGESAREYALFASKGSRAYLLPDGKVVKITGNKGEVKTVKMDKRQYNEFANKVSLRFGDYVRDNFEELSKYPSQREYDKLVEEGKETPYPPFDEVVKDEKNIIIESVLQDMFLGAKEKSYPIRLVTKEE